MCCVRWWPQSLAILTGVHAFKGPPDRGSNGNFGFHGGLNMGGPLKPACGIGYQVGANWISSNYAGDQVVSPTTDERHQVFITAGLFRKVMQGCGVQGGIVFDHLNDDYYVEMNLSQVRGELSFIGPWCHEAGVWFTAGTRRDHEQIGNQFETWESTDLFAFFYRRHFGGGGQFRIWGGFTGRSDGLAGGEMSVPFSNDFAMQAHLNYLIPEEGGSIAGIGQESWALGINLVWYPGGTARGATFGPLFNVADNSTFMIDRLIGR
jgi:hypothetical protein